MKMTIIAILISCLFVSCSIAPADIDNYVVSYENPTAR